MNINDNYVLALTLCGADVKMFRRFRSYQGDWIAYVEHNNEQFFVHGTFGSCTVCDHFYSEMSDSKYNIYDIKYMLDGEPVDIPWSDEFEYRPLTEHERLELIGEIRTIGYRYLDDPLTYDQIFNIVNENIDWDEDAIDMVNFVKECKEKYETK